MDVAAKGKAMPVNGNLLMVEDRDKSLMPNAECGYSLRSEFGAQQDVVTVTLFGYRFTVSGKYLNNMMEMFEGLRTDLETRALARDLVEGNHA